MAPNEDATRAELSVLELLWERGESTIREITDALYPDGGTAHYATVQKLLDRLEAKSLVRRKRVGRAHRFAAAADRSELIGRRLRSVADQLCRGALAPLLTHLVSDDKLGTDEIDTLKRLLAEVEGRRKEKPE